MTIIKRFFIALLSVAALFGCEKDGNLITLSGLEANELMATKTDVVLTQETANEQALSLAWNNSTLTVSDPSMSAPNVLKTMLQISKTADFAIVPIEYSEANPSHTFTGSELNAVAKTVGTEPGVATPIYFRIKSSVGDNIDPVYSNVVTVSVTSYVIDMTNGFILDKEMAATGRSLFSAASDGQYTGFMGATAWYNFYLKEGDGKIWGNDGISGTPFVLSSSEETDARWSCWFPGIGGCYHVDFNTNKKTWSALLIPALTVSGDISGEMIFDRPNVKWTLPFTATTTSLTIQISGSGKQYDNATGTDDAAALDKAIAFSQSGSTLALSSEAGNITITVPKAGDYTLTLDLSNPKAWSIVAAEGTSVPNEPNPFLYLPGVDDGISGSWTFDNYLSLYNEDELSYAGVVNVNTKWGYTMNPEKDNWEDKYTFESGDALAGVLVHKGTANIPAPEAGLYLIDASLKALSYNLTSVGSQIYVSGLNDAWDFNTALNQTANIGEYVGSITISKASQYGFQIHLDASWNHYFGGSGGKLTYKGNNITDDATLAAGTYTLTVNLIKGTYILSK